MRLPDEQKWDVELLQGVSATPFQLHVAKAPEIVFRKQGEPERVGALVVIARNVYIKAADLEAYGRTRECGRCDHELKYGANRS